MEKKIFFIDFDGTLMRDDKTISDKNREALRNAGTLYRPCNQTSCQQRSENCKRT